MLNEEHCSGYEVELIRGPTMSVIPVRRSTSLTEEDRFYVQSLMSDPDNFEIEVRREDDFHAKLGGYGSIRLSLAVAFQRFTKKDVYDYLKYHFPDLGEQRITSYTHQLQEAARFSIKNSVLAQYDDLSRESKVHRNDSQEQSSSKVAHQRSLKDPNEIERFKSEINLTEYAAASGWSLIQRESSRNSIVMKRGNDKIIVAKQEEHYVYFSVHQNHSGSIIDFVQNQKHLNLGEVRKELRPWIGLTSSSYRPRIQPDKYVKEIAATSTDVTKVQAEWLKARAVEDYSYAKSRGLERETIKWFGDSIRQDDRGNLLFAHRDYDGICGFEVKNKGFTGFSAGGEKALWFGRVGGRNERIVICESAIDALSYAQLYPFQNTLFVSFAGAWSPKQNNLIEALIGKNKNAQFVLGVDRDSKGDAFSDRLGSMTQGLNVKRDIPVLGKDWNDQLRHQQKLELRHSYGLGR